MILALIAALGMTLSAQASHIDTVCRLAHEVNPENPTMSRANPPLFTEGYLARIDREKNAYVIEDHEGQEIFRYPDAIIALEVKSKVLWALGRFELLQLTLDGQLIARHKLGLDTNPSWKARAMTLAGDQLVIARGNAGLMGFDTKTLKVEWHTLMGEVKGGMPVAVAFDGEKVQVAMATSGPVGFTGIATFNLSTLVVERQTPYDQVRAGVIDTYAKMRWHNEAVVLNNGGWIHVITKKQLQAGRMMRPRWVAVEIPARGEVNLHYMTLSGEFFFEGNELIGCGVYNSDETGRMSLKSQTFRVSLP